MTSLILSVVRWTLVWLLRIWTDICRKHRRLSTILPDVIGAWTTTTPYGAEPDGDIQASDGGHFVSGYEMQPTTVPSTPASPLQKPEPIYLEVSGSATGQSTISSVDSLPNVHSPPPLTSILVDPTSLERRNNKGQVRIFVSCSLFWVDKRIINTWIYTVS